MKNKNKNGIAFGKMLFLGIILTIFSGASNAQTTYTFTPCGATGSVGPSQTQVNSAYLSTNLNGSVTIPTSSPGVQTFTIPLGAGGGYRPQHPQACHI